MILPFFVYLVNKKTLISSATCFFPYAKYYLWLNNENNKWGKTKEVFEKKSKLSTQLDLKRNGYKIFTIHQLRQYIPYIMILSVFGAKSSKYNETIEQIW